MLSNNNIDLPSINTVINNINSGLYIILVKGSRCPPCIALMNYLNSDGKPWAQVIKQIQNHHARAQFIYADIHNDEIPCLQEANIRSIPTFVIINNGDLIGCFKAGGLHTVDNLVNNILSVLGN